MVSMCRWLILVVLTLAACASPPPPPPDEPLQLWAEHTLPRAATVLLRLDGDSFCGAVAIAPALIATARHCIDSGVAFFTTGPADTTYDAAQVIASDPVADITLMRVIGRPFPAWPTIREAPANGEPVYSINHARGDHWQTYDGYARGMVGPFIMTDIWIRPGASGSGLWDQQGRLVGIVSRYELNGPTSFFGSGDAVRRLLDSVSR